MGGTNPACPPEFRWQMVGLVRAGAIRRAWRAEPSTQAIRNWVRRADCDGGQRSDGLTTGE